MSVTRFESVSVAEHERRIVSVWLRTSVQACRCEHVLECVIHLAWARLAVSGTGPSSGAGKPGSGLGSLQQVQQRLCDAQEVDHLSNAEQRGDDQGTTVGALQEG